ncbi:hypothetical protein B0H11DRAFT_2277455 [Mycena galericulata]|nr:hypothetical protein B0H11DRAFT_2277455 [Mycena galericulata]
MPILSSAKRCALDVTACDIEPAVTARNLLLFTLIYDGHQNHRIWNIFYHIKIDQTSFALLISQSKKLLDITRDLETWQTSAYSGVLRFCSVYTLSHLRRYLRLYAQAEFYPPQKHIELFSSFTREFEARHGPYQLVPDTSRPAGPFAMCVQQMLRMHFIHYWTTGTVSLSATDVASAIFINPTFVYSESSSTSLVGDRCTLHYGTYPLHGFHLASAFLDPSAEKVTVEQLVLCAQSQFQEWCSAFKIAVSSSQPTITIRLFIGDALPFCRRLTHLKTASAHPDSHLYVNSWTAAELVLDSGEYDGIMSAPTSFDVIDSSNIADHVGLLNVLIAAIPLLVCGPTSVLYTEAVLQKEIGGSEASDFVKLLCADVPTIGLLLGVSPANFIAQFTAIPEAGLHEVPFPPRIRQRIGWKLQYPVGLPNTDGEIVVIPSFSDPLALANVLFHIHKQMFADLGQDIVHYHPATFAALLGHIKSRIRSDWSAVMDNVFELLSTDRNRMLGSNDYTELCCQLYLRGVCSLDAFSPRRAVIGREHGRFKGWREIPPVVCLIFVVPRENIHILEGKDGRQFGTTMFECEIRGPTFRSIFSCIQAVLGNASIQGDGQVSIVEDAAGWSGTSPLIISAFVPATILAFDPNSTQVCLRLHSTPQTVLLLRSTLGPTLALFTASLMDTNAVHVTMNGPNRSPTPLEPLPPFTTLRSQVSIGIAGSHVSTMSARWEMKADEWGTGLKEAKIGHIQISPCIIELVIDQAGSAIREKMVYPFPVDGTQAKLRIARKSGWIEIEVPIRHCTPSGPADFCITSFHLRNRCPIVWNIHRVNMSALPGLKVGNTHFGRLAYTLQSHFSSAFSVRDCALVDHNKRKKLDLLAKVKDTICHLIVGITGANSVRVFVFSDQEKGGIDTIIHVNGIRLDKASATFIVDAGVLPLTKNLLRGRLGPKIRAVSEEPETPTASITMTVYEVQAWKHLLVAFTERCRSWTHNPTCKYALLGQTPASVEMLQNPLCGCGEGIDLGDISFDPHWKDLAPLMTRAAISPLFGIEYLETVAQLEHKLAVALSNECEACHKPERMDSKLLKCSQCKKVAYCGKACQNGDWKVHKKVCKTI